MTACHKSVLDVSVIEHHEMTCPFMDHYGRVMGALWLIVESSDRPGNNMPVVAILTVKNGRIHIWNGMSFTQELDDFAWASRSKYLPLLTDGTPVP